VDLVLYVSGASPHSEPAKRNCETLLSRFDRRRVRFEVCDISLNPDRAEADAVCYTPMLVKRAPAPRMCVVGDLSNITVIIDLLESCGLDLVR
jgi:circadian clock protein KaiB